jgi:hypothetical protein
LSFLATFHSFVNPRYSDISIDRNDFDARFLITFRENLILHCKKAMLFGPKMTIIIIAIIKYHGSKHYIYNIFIKPGGSGGSMS